MTAADCVEEVVPLGEGEISVLRPRDFEALLTEEAFEREELLPYWAELWSSGVALARQLRRRALRGARTLELGCGLALPSIAAALAGGRVTATDWSAEAVAMASLNARRNGVEMEVAPYAWGEPGVALDGAPWDLVLASDVLYERRNVELLLGLLPRLVDRRGEVWIADPGREPAGPFLEAAASRWEVRTSRSAGAPKVELHRLTRRSGDGPPQGRELSGG